jgi:hypothetical protein
LRSINRELEHFPGRGEDVAERARGIREQLHPSILDHLGMVGALRSECLNLCQRDGLTVNYHA